MVALTGMGGGALGGLFQRVLWFGFGGGGTFVALLAWLIIGIAVLLDKPVKDLFFWLAPIDQLDAEVAEQTHRASNSAHSKLVLFRQKISRR